MSATDRAFIKAYAWDRAEPAPPEPHLQFSSTAAQSGVAGSSVSSSAQRTMGAAPATALTGVNQKPGALSSKFLPPSLQVAKQGITHFVPAPHIPLGGAAVGRPSERKTIKFSGRNPVADNSQESAKSAVPVPEPARPLSEFVKEEPAVERFEPALGVPYFPWPEVCNSLLSNTQADYSSLHAALKSRAGASTPVIALTSMYRGEGRTTTLLCTARELARRGLRTVLVDGDFSRPTLSVQLGIAATSGWEDVLTGRLTLAEAVIHSEQDQIALLPLGETVRDPHSLASALHATISLAVLSQHYDVVLVDVGPLYDEPSTANTLLRRAKFTGTLLVQDVRRWSPDLCTEVRLKLAELQLPLLGVIENFITGSSRQGDSRPSRTTAA